MNKKGFVYDRTQPSVFKNLDVGWYYTWGLQGSVGVDRPFTPMIWGAPDAHKLSQIPAGSTEILAFNEPDGNQAGAQSNISIKNVKSDR